MQGYCASPTPGEPTGARKGIFLGNPLNQLCSNFLAAEAPQSAAAATGWGPEFTELQPGVYLETGAASGISLRNPSHGLISHGILLI